MLRLQLVVISSLLLSTPAIAQLPMPQYSGEPLSPPPINQNPYIQPSVNNGSGQVFEFQAPQQQNPQFYQQAPIPQYNQAYERYSVIVDANGYNGQLLQQVKRVEPGAYIRNIGGRSVIQAGVFNRQQNAVLRIQQLLATGINFNNVKLINPINGQEIAITPAGNDGIGGNLGSNTGDNNSNYYYVAIPTRPEDFAQIEQAVWRSLGQYVNYIGVRRRNQPLGAHVAVGPFSERGQAEQWNAVLKNAGIANARVYYGR